MEPLDASALATGALLLVDTAPIVYALEARAAFAPHFAPLFERHARGETALAVTTISIAEVLVGPLASSKEALAKRYRAALETRPVVELDVDVAANPSHSGPKQTARQEGFQPAIRAQRRVKARPTPRRFWPVVVTRTQVARRARSHKNRRCRSAPCARSGIPSPAQGRWQPLTPDLPAPPRRRMAGTNTAADHQRGGGLRGPGPASGVVRFETRYTARSLTRRIPDFPGGST